MTKLTKNGEYMFKDVEELKSFIIWAKEQQIQSIAIGDVKVEVSPLYFTNQLINPVPSDSAPTTTPSSKRWIEDPAVGEEDEELAFWSSGG